MSQPHWNHTQTHQWELKSAFLSSFHLSIVSLFIINTGDANRYCAIPPSVWYLFFTLWDTLTPLWCYFFLLAQIALINKRKAVPMWVDSQRMGGFENNEIILRTSARIINSCLVPFFLNSTYKSLMFFVITNVKCMWWSEEHQKHELNQACVVSLKQKHRDMR